MKAAIVGTQNYTPNIDPSTLLREIGVNGLQNLAGYMPPTMPVNNQVFWLPSVADVFAEMADGVMYGLHNKRKMESCNPRAAYLALAQVVDMLEKKYISIFKVYHPAIRYAKFLLIGIAAGNILSATSTKPRLTLTDVRSVWMKFALKATERSLELCYRDDNIFKEKFRNIQRRSSAAARSNYIGELVASALGGWSTRGKIQEIASDWAYISEAQSIALLQNMLLNILIVDKGNGKPPR